MPETLSFAFSSADGLMRSANYLLDHMDDDGPKRNPNKYSFILVAAAAMESMLNDGIVSWAHGAFPKVDYKRHASAFLGMSLRGKLDVIGHLISGGSHLTDNSSETYQYLSDLVSLRNQVAHSKDFFTEAEVEIVTDSDGNKAFEFPEEIAKKFEKSPLIFERDQYVSIYTSLYMLFEVLNQSAAVEEYTLFKAAA